jgi:hypothetical protein
MQKEKTDYSEINNMKRVPSTVLDESRGYLIGKSDELRQAVVDDNMILAKEIVSEIQRVVDDIDRPWIIYTHRPNGKAEPMYFLPPRLQGLPQDLLEDRLQAFDPLR